MPVSKIKKDAKSLSSQEEKCLAVCATAPDYDGDTDNLEPIKSEKASSTTLMTLPLANQLIYQVIPQ